jgi:hypothetical protein
MSTDHLFSTSGAAELTERQIDDVARNYRFAFGQQERREAIEKPKADPNQLGLGIVIIERAPRTAVAGCSSCGDDFIVEPGACGFSHCDDHEGLDHAA